MGQRAAAAGVTGVRRGSGRAGCQRAHRAACCCTGRAQRLPRRAAGRGGRRGCSKRRRYWQQGTLYAIATS